MYVCQSVNKYWSQTGTSPHCYMRQSKKSLFFLEDLFGYNTGYLDHIFRLSQLQNLSVFSADLFGLHSWHFYHNNATMELVQEPSKPIGFLKKGGTNLIKREASQLHSGSNCKQSLKFTHHTCKRDVTEVTKIWLK